MNIDTIIYSIWLNMKDSSYKNNYQEYLTINRINNNGNWVTYKQQANNKKMLEE